MKKLFFLIMLGVVGSIPFHSSAQVSINVNIGSQPLWGPTGYNHVDYYYMPDIESYYYVPTRQFIYLSNGNWVFSAGLPSRYRSYDLYHGYKVVINSPKPYRYFKTHRVKYSRYRSYRSQPVIRYSSHSKHYVVKGHPRSSSHGYSKYRGHGNDHRSSRSHGHGRH